MISSITPVIKKKYTNDNFGIINIRVICQRKTIYKSTGISFKVKDWSDSKLKVLTSNTNHQEYNQILKDLLLLLDGRSFIEIKRFSLSELKSIPQKESKALIDYGSTPIDIKADFEKVIFELNEVFKFTTAKTYNTALVHFSNFSLKINSKKLTYDRIDLKWIKDFEHYLKTTGMAKNSILKVIGHFRARFRWQRKAKALLVYHDPFSEFNFGKEEVKKEALTKNQITELALLNVENDFELEKSLNSFLFQILVGGIRISDFLTMRFSNLLIDENECDLELTQYKTKGDATLIINEENIKYITFATNYKLYRELYKDKRYNFSYNGMSIKGTLNEIEAYGGLLHESSIELDEFDENWSKYISQYKSITSFIYRLQLESLKEKLRNHQNDFIFNYLNNELFKNVIFDKSTVLNKKQHSHFESKKTTYNKKLKRLNHLSSSNLSLHSHHARHSAANVMLQNEIGIYSISKILGHKKLATTEQYLDSFSSIKIKKDLESYKERLIENRIRKTQKPSMEDPFAQNIDKRDPIFGHMENTPYIDAFVGEEVR